MAAGSKLKAWMQARGWYNIAALQCRVRWRAKAIKLSRSLLVDAITLIILDLSTI